MQYTEKPKEITAFQFRGPKDIYDIKLAINPQKIEYADGVGISETLTLFVDAKEHTVKRRDYIIYEIVEGTKRVTVMSSDEFEDKYQQVPFSITAAKIGNAQIQLQSNDAGVITGIGVGPEYPKQFTRDLHTAESK